MARKRATPDVVPTRSKTGFRSIIVTPTPSPAAERFATIGPDHAWWEETRESLEKLVEPGTRYVRLRPPDHLNDAEVLELKGRLERQGYLVQPPPPRQLAAVARQIAAPRHESAREAVEALVAESRSQDRAALEVVVQATMTAVGL